MATQELDPVAREIIRKLQELTRSVTTTMDEIRAISMEQSGKRDARIGKQWEGFQQVDVPQIEEAINSNIQSLAGALVIRDMLGIETE